ncbi:hypothetical protein VIBHAR_05222 [Vibrio campbellii ATCC BAA-1116]|uniref:HotDog ACOT-type domain-containing protein n=1 Tax=Vibrio campbellii (strain ATCC BAA-1116) TaxID=2902295 RepID=A7N662_VIBC1|nr:hypothetical protein VIBHAR_05222 [Vibrio campbellii ATCC BAA-1116]
MAFLCPISVAASTDKKVNILLHSLFQYRFLADTLDLIATTITKEWQMSSGQRDITLRFLAEPGDVNFGGKVHGGAVMKWIDLAAYACSAAWSGKYCITAYAGGIRFVAPIHVGNLVEVSAKVIYTGRSSMHIAIDVQASDPKELKNRLTHMSLLPVNRQ